MIRKQIYLTEEINRLLQQKSQEKGVPQSELIREGLAQYLTRADNKHKQWDDLLAEMEHSPYSHIDWDREEANERSH